jgi:hypothetical protein
MRKRITIDVSGTDRDTLTAMVTGCGTMELTHRTGTSKTSVWRWQERFMAEGVPGLLRDKTRPARIPSLGSEVTVSYPLALQGRS